MTPQLDPATWPARVASLVTRLRSELQTYEDRIDSTTIADWALEEAGHTPGVTGPAPPDVGQDWPVHAGEAELLATATVDQMLANGEVAKRTDGRNGKAKFIDDMAPQLGWIRQSHQFVMLHGLGPTQRLLDMHHEAPLHSSVDEPTKWANVDRLLREMRTALTAGLDVAASVTARVATEEGVRLALIDLGEDDSKVAGWRAAEREDELFKRLSGNRGFDPMDRSATRAQLSAARDAGNNAAHQGYVSDRADLYARTLILGRALRSLSAAVTSAAGHGES